MLRANRATEVSWWGSLPTAGGGGRECLLPSAQAALLWGTAVLAFAAGCSWPSRGRGTLSTWHKKGVELDVVWRTWTMSVLQVVLAAPLKALARVREEA